MTVFTIDTDVVDYSTFTALYDAKDAGSLVAGNAYRVAWSGDAYAPDGEFVTTYDGTDFTVHPFQTNLIFPTWLWDTADWTEVGDASYSQDGAGRPVISTSVGGSGGKLQLSSRYQFTRPRQVKVEGSWTFGAQNANDRFGFQIYNIADAANAYVNIYQRWDTTAYTQNLQAIDTSNVQDFQNVAGVGDWEGDVWIWSANDAFDAVPNWQGAFRENGGSKDATLTASNGHGDWGTDGGYDYSIALYATFNDLASQGVFRTLQVIADYTALP